MGLKKDSYLDAYKVPLIIWSPLLKQSKQFKSLVSHDDITPSLFDVIASVKNTRDEESSQMVQLIIRNRVFDPVRMYYIEGHNIADDLLASKSTDVASYIARNETKAAAALDKIISAFSENT